MNLRIAGLLVLIAPMQGASFSGPAMSVVATINVSITAAAADRTGNLYLIGTTGLSQLATTPGAVKAACDNPCYSDAIILKVAPNGRVQYATYFGGSSNETGNAIAVDGDGNIYVAGTTWSSDFPVTGTALVAPAPTQQGFIAKLSPQGRLVFSTPVGGSGVSTIAIDADAAVYVAGVAHRDTVPMVNAIQPRVRGQSDAFVAKISPDATTLLFSTYLGGQSTESATALTLDGARNVIVIGDTMSTDYPAVRAEQRALNGIRDGFVTKLANDGSRLEFSSYLGGRELETSRAVGVAPDGTIYVTGTTMSADFPVTEGALDVTCGTDGACNPHVVTGKGGPRVSFYTDAFVSAFSADGHWVFSTFLGGERYDEGRSLMVNEDGQIFVSGFSTSREFAASGALCESELDCRPFLASLDTTGAITTHARVPVTASYAPWFDYVPLALADGSPVVITNRRGTATISKFSGSTDIPQ